MIWVLTALKNFISVKCCFHAHEYNKNIALWLRLELSNFQVQPSSGNRPLCVSAYLSLAKIENQNEWVNVQADFEVTFFKYKGELIHHKLLEKIQCFPLMRVWWCRGLTRQSLFVHVDIGIVWWKPRQSKVVQKRVAFIYRYWKYNDNKFCQITKCIKSRVFFYGHFFWILNTNPMW